MDQLAHDVSLYPLEGERFLSRWAYVGLQARHNLLLIVPPLFLIVLQQLIFNVFPGIAESGPWLPLLGVVLLGIAFASIPYLLRWFLGLRPLPAGPIRERLESAARRLDFRFSDILVWDTRRTVANAMVTGILPWMRYIVVTDRLLEALSADEIEGVFGHEVGHVKHHHMFFYMLFMIGSLVALGGVGYLATHLVKEPGVQAWLRGSAPGLLAVVEQVQVYALLPLLLLFAVYLFVVFGYLSRRCERQADIYGCRSVSTQAFVDALEKVAILNGISRENPGWFSCWQHGSIAHRVAFLERMNGDPALEPRFQSRLRLLKWGVVLGLGGVAACVVLTMNHLLRPEDMWRFFQNL